MNAAAFVLEVEHAMRALADPRRASDMKAYMRGQFEFVGVPTPMRRQIGKSLPPLAQDAQALLRIARALWRKPEREYHYVACDVLIKNARLFSIADLPAFKTLLQKDAWWDTVDALSGAIGDIVAQERRRGLPAQEAMDAWLDDPDFWVRRSAMIHQLGWRLQTDTERLGRYALALSGDPEFFIRKAIGWAFRDYARWNPVFVQQFMKKHETAMSALSVREATKHLKSQ